jgi:hypothetical protein
MAKEDSNLCERRAAVFRLRAGLLFEGVFFLNCFFLTVLFGAIVRRRREASFCFAVAVFDFDFVGLLFVFFFLEGMAAVYHRGLSRP